MTYNDNGTISIFYDFENWQYEEKNYEFITTPQEVAWIVLRFDRAETRKVTSNDMLIDLLEREGISDDEVEYAFKDIAYQEWENSL